MFSPTIVTALLLCVGAAFAADLGLPPSAICTGALRIGPHPGVFAATNGALPTSEGSIDLSQPLTIWDTTVLRATAFRRGETPLTRTYIFPEKVLEQRGEGLPGTWGSKNGEPVRADYEMDPEIVCDPEYREAILKSLRALPSVSLVLPVGDLFGSERGIYAHPEETGGDWERACSFEWIEPERGNFQVDCGIRVQGGWNRRPEESPKHSFRLVFKKKYGAGKLKFAVFGKTGPKEFDELILRSGCNNSWLHWSGRERQRGEYIRDQWMRDSLDAMGHPSAAGTFVHLYLNGLYWGLYNLTERPDANFAAAHFGGAGKDYDAFNSDKTLSGTRGAWEDLMSCLRGKQDLGRIRPLLDLESFADYMLLNLYGANADWDRASNWYAVRRRHPPGPFEFLVWDGERTLENTTDDTFAFSDDESPPGIFHRLIENDGFRKLFTARAKLHLGKNGALAPERAAARYRSWADKIELAMAAESARWGDYRRDVHPYKEGPYELYTLRDHWRPEVRRLLNEYFPQRTAVFVNQLRAHGLWPAGD